MTTSRHDTAAQLTSPGFHGRTTLVAALLAASAAAYLCRVSFRAAHSAGYDFRYLWLAGRLWLDGVSPYLPGYQEAGSVLIEHGHLPEIWVYPPNWWPITTLLALTDLHTANLAWGLAGVLFAAGTSLLTVSAFQRCCPAPRLAVPFSSNLYAVSGVFVLLHFFVTAALEATALTLAVGQTSLLVALGVGLLLYGASRASLGIASAGLSVVFLKPQIGIVFLIVLPLLGHWARRLALSGITVSAVLALPAAIVDPMVLLHFVQNVSSYDGFTDANLPQAMTGVRLAIWELFHRDIGNIAAVAATAGMAVLLVIRTVRRGEGIERPQLRVWGATMVTVAVIVAMAPLHYYDFVLAVALVPLLLTARGWYLGAGLLGGALILRADWLGKLTGLYDPGVAIFEGSILATVGGVLLLAATLDTTRRWS